MNSCVLSSDFQLSEGFVTFSEQTDVACVNLTISVDTRVENDEELSMVINSTDLAVEILTERRLVRIIDQSTGKMKHQLLSLAFMYVQWNVRIKDTVRSAILSSVERLSSRRLKMNDCYGKGVQKYVPCWEVAPFSEG